MHSFSLLISLLLLTGLYPGPPKPKPDGWIQLFNGKDLKDWSVKITGHPLNDNYGNTFRVEDGKMVVRYDQYKNFDEQFGHIFYKKPFSAYLLLVEYRFVGEQVAGGPGWAVRNSGAMLHGQDPKTMGLKQDFPISLEMQLLGGDGQHERHTANLCTPGTNVVMNGKLFTPHCIDSNSKTYHDDRWVRAEALVLGDSLVKHIVEGDTVLTYTKPQIGGGNVIHFNSDQKKDGQLLRQGYISLQSESHPIEFRKVSLFDLSPYLRKPKELQAVLRQLQTRKL
ncbi:3-keto-disaccharide hydrolase [Larkinella sp. VNQ87]|uniref:3-keto-disaccharide hydrolase n=1 Tax=Larkinella sp. VNQ87 TaxID=3400921 RepID=UPI003C121B66